MKYKVWVACIVNKDFSKKGWKWEYRGKEEEAKSIEDYEMRFNNQIEYRKEFPISYPYIGLKVVNAETNEIVFCKVAEEI